MELDRENTHVRNKVVQETIEVNSCYKDHYDWCQAITSQLDVQVFPKIMRGNSAFHEITVFIFPEGSDFSYNTRKRIHDIISSRPETFYLTLHEPIGREAILANFIVKHSLTNTITGFLTNRFDPTTPSLFKNYLVKAKNGVEQWLFSGLPNTIDLLFDFVIESGLGNARTISNQKSDKLAIDMYKRFFKALGTSEKTAKLLGVSKFYGLLDNPFNEDIQYLVSKRTGYDQEKLAYELNQGVLTCSWVHGAVEEMRKQKSMKETASTIAS